ncbi:MAG: DUF4124 domain-containing protein [Gammaproteobacteria bacterium]|nr:DUF4124 domain-containing protein [Gammaproteobacteria bacterium]
MIFRSRQGIFASLLVLGCCLTGSEALAEAGYYKWFDERGNPHHSDRPPPSGVEYEFISTDTGMRRRISSVADTSTTSPAPAMPTPETKPVTVAEQQTKIKKNPAYCDQAKANLDTLDSKARVRIRSPEGDIRYLSEEEKDIQRKKAKDTIAVHCN